MTAKRRRIAVCGNGAAGPRDALRLSYGPGDKDRIELRLPRFIEHLGYLPPRLLDLIEIAAYVMAADRETSRGATDAVVYDAWSRYFSFRIRVRDLAFWSGPDVVRQLAETIGFTSGDRPPRFEFSGGHATPRVHLFDLEGSAGPEVPEGTTVGLFSGGLDSLAGAYDALHNTNQRLVLVSHRSRPDVKKSQDGLLGALGKRFPDRLTHVPFEFRLRGPRPPEET